MSVWRCWCRRDRREAARIGSGRIQITERLVDKDQRKDERSGRYDRCRDGYEKYDAIERRRAAERDIDDLGSSKGRYSRDVDSGFSSRSDRDDGFRSDRYDHSDESRTNKSRLDRDRDDMRYDSRLKDGSFRSKVQYCMSRRVCMCIQICGTSGR